MLEGQNLNNRQTVFFLLVDPIEKNNKDPDEIDLNEPRRAQYLHNAWKRHRMLGRHQSCSEERIEVLSDSIERYHASCNISSLLYSESCQDGNWRSHLRKSIHVNSSSAKDLPYVTTGKENWVQKVLNDQKDKLCNNSKDSNRTNQFQTQIMIERGKPFLEPIERGNPLLELTREPGKVKEKRPVPKRSKHVLFTKNLSKTIEQGIPLKQV